MRTKGMISKRRAVLAFFLAMIGLVMYPLFFGSALAAPVTLPSGVAIELSREQVESIKAQPGVSFSPEPIKKLSTGQVSVALPDELGGGQVHGTPGALAKAFAHAGATGGTAASVHLFKAPITRTSHPQPESTRTGFYLGAGLSAAFPQFSIDDQNFDGDFDKAAGVNVKLGYTFNRWFSLELDLEYISKFQWDDEELVGGVPAKADAEVDVFTSMLALKLSPDIGTPVIRPFIVGAGGLMYADIDVKFPSSSESDSEKDLSAKAGGGIDFHLGEHLLLWLEGSYVWGFGDLKDISYGLVTLGAGYRF